MPLRRWLSWKLMSVVCWLRRRLVLDSDSDVSTSQPVELLLHDCHRVAARAALLGLVQEHQYEDRDDHNDQDKDDVSSGCHST